MRLRHRNNPAVATPHEAIAYLASACDGAIRADGHGFATHHVDIQLRRVKLRRGAIHESCEFLQTVDDAQGHMVERIDGAHVLDPESEPVPLPDGTHPSGRTHRRTGRRTALSAPRHHPTTRQGVRLSGQGG